MTLNLDKYKDALVGAYREVMDEKNPLNWALYSYEGQSFDLTLVSKGDGGLEELNEDFNSGKIMYALCRVKVKEKNVEKIVLINWQGEGAPLSRKGMSANHLGTIRSYFKGIHVSINARTEEDVEPDAVEATVAKAIAGEGVKMSSNIEAEGQIGPVGTCYKRVNPLEEINSSAKDEFWRREEQEEVRRKKEEQTKLRKFSQNEVKLLRRESQDYFHEQERESISTTSSSSVSPQPLTPTTKVNGLSSTINSASVAAVKASTPRKNSTGNSGDLVRQRIKSFDNGSPPQSTINYAGNGLSNGSNGTKEKESLSVLKRKQLFESGGASNTINTVVRKNPAQEIKSALSQQESKPPQPLNRPPQSPQPPKQVETIKSDEKFVPINNQNRIVEPTTPTTIPAVINKSPSPQPSVIINKSYSPPPQVVQMRQQQPSPIPPSPQENSTPVNGGYNGYIPPPLAVEEPTNNYYEDNTVQSAEQHTASPVPDEGRLTPSMTIEITPEMGLCARALYDYQAADDSEITFDPGEVITNIERIDEGWWEGAGPRGTYGLFPANYVEVLNP